jgi:hypothetical protein
MGWHGQRHLDCGLVNPASWLGVKNGILCDDEGFDILINVVARTFRDRKMPAYEAGRVIKRKHHGDIIEVRDRSTGAKVVMLEDGRTG